MNAASGDGRALTRDRLAQLVASVVLAAMAMLVAAHPTAGQTQAAPAESDASPCLGFSFGPWSPALDWQRAGHRVPVDTARVARTAEGRGWAVTTRSASGDSALILFPAWWPAGVIVELGTRAPAPGDTIAGRATAMVADGRLQPPVSRIRAWRVPCTRPVDPP